MPCDSDNRELPNRIEHLAGLLEEVDRHTDPDVQRKVGEIITTLNELQGAALATILRHVEAEGEAGRRIVEALAGDELVSSLLILHGLHPDDLPERVERAIASVRPYLESHGGNVEIVDLSPTGDLRLRLEGSCDGCPSSQATLRGTIEEAIFAWAPDIASLEVEGLAAERETNGDAAFVPLAQLGISSTQNGRPR